MFITIARDFSEENRLGLYITFYYQGGFCKNHIGSRNLNFHVRYHCKSLRSNKTCLCPSFQIDIFFKIEFLSDFTTQAIYIPSTSYISNKQLLSPCVPSKAGTHYHKYSARPTI